MNIADIILNLQQLATSSTNTLELMTIAKSIEKLKVGAVQTVATFGDLPTLPLAEDGELFLVEADELLYYNVESEWVGVGPESIAMSWGSSSVGQLGDGTGVAKSSPVTVLGGIRNWSFISAESFHAIGIADGVAYAWGSGSSGRLGDGTTVNKSSPVTVLGGITNWSQVSAGGSHSLGVAGGIAYGWGSGSNGRVGDNSIFGSASPVTVSGSLTNWTQVSAGLDHSLGIAGGIAYGWGRSYAGRLGDDSSFVDKSSPVTVVGGITNWSQISGGSGFSLGLTSTGIAYAWGTASAGQLGDDTGANKSSPVTVIGGITNWSQISAGGNHSIGLTSSGILYGWGRNAGFEGYGGMLGDGTIINRSSPVTVVGGITNWSSVDAGSNHVVALTNAGIAYAWGQASYGAVGDGTVINRSSPVTIIGGVTNWTQISAGRNQSIAIKSR